MNDPYEVLGIGRNASDDEVKSAYRALAQKYHPDRYAGNPLSDLAEEKMQEINEAYDTIVRERKNKQSSYTSSSSGSSYYSSSSSSSGNDQSGYASTQYNDVRRMMNQNRFTDAETILNGVPESAKNAEWYYLKGIILYRKGWLDQGYSYVSRACQMEPYNQEYQSALSNMSGMRSNQVTQSTSSDLCQMCATAVCCSMCMRGCR